MRILSPMGTSVGLPGDIQIPTFRSHFNSNSDAYFAQPDDPQPMLLAPPHQVQVALTVADLTRRVRDPFERAIQQRDLEYLRSVANVYACMATVTPSSVILNSREPQELAQARKWIERWFADCSGEPSLCLVCAGTPTHFELRQHTRTIAHACSVPADRVLNPVSLPNSPRQQEQRVVSAQLKYESEALSQIITALRNHIKLKSLQYCESHMGKRGARNDVTSYFASLLQTPDQSEYAGELTAPAPVTQEKPRTPQAVKRVAVVPVKREEVAPSPDAATTPAPATSAQPASDTAVTLSQEVTQALFNRVSFFQRRVSRLSAQTPLSTEDLLQGELRVAMQCTDPMDVAALACMLWDIGAKTARPAADRRAPSKHFAQDKSGSGHAH